MLDMRDLQPILILWCYVGANLLFVIGLCARAMWRLWQAARHASACHGDTSSTTVYLRRSYAKIS